MPKRTELESSLLSRIRGMTREEMEYIIKRHGNTENLDPFHNYYLQEHILSLTLKGEINHAELM